MNLSRDEWQQITAKLKEPFKPEQVSWRVQGKAAPNSRAQVCAYIDARDVMDRLDAVCGSENWVFDWDGIVVEGGAVKVAKGKLSLFGSEPKCDVGDSGSIEANKSAISDALKRSAVHWGVGRYLYELDAEWITLDSHGRIPDAEMKRLQASLTGEKSKPAPAQPQRPQPAPAKPAAQAPQKPQPPAAQQTTQTPAPINQRAILWDMAEKLGYDRDGFNDLLQQYTFDNRTQLRDVKEHLEREQAQRKSS